MRLQKIENSPTLYTERLILRRFEEADSEDFFKIFGDEEVNRFLPYFLTETLEQAKEELQKRYLSTYEKECGYRYAICLATDRRAIGYIGLSAGNSHDFGYCLRKEFWNQGIVSEAAQAVVDRIREAGYPYITATHDVENPASGGVMKKIGMTYRYSYREQWQPKDISVVFRMYQLNFEDPDYLYREYWDKYGGYVEEGMEERIPQNS